MYVVDTNLLQHYFRELELDTYKKDGKKMWRLIDLKLMNKNI